MSKLHKKKRVSFREISPEEMKEIITGIFEAKIDNAERMRKILKEFEMESNMSKLHKKKRVSFREMLYIILQEKFEERYK